MCRTHTCGRSGRLLLAAFGEATVEWPGASRAAPTRGRYLFVAFMVASCVLIRRYHQPGVTKPGPTIIRWLLIVLFSIGAAL